MGITKTSLAVREAMRRKSPANMPDDPSRRGWTTEEIKRAYYDYVIGSTNSILSELDRIIDQYNGGDGALIGRMQELYSQLTEALRELSSIPARVSDLEATLGSGPLSLTIGEETGDIQLKSGGDVLSQVSLGGLELKLNGKILSLAMVTGAATILLGSCVLDGITGGGNDCKWTETEREQLATVLEHNAYADTEALETAQTLIESLRGGGTQEPAEPEPVYITMTFSMPGAVAVIGGNTIVDGSAYIVEASTNAVQVTVRPVSSGNSAWPSDGAVITVGGAVPSDGQEVTLDGLSCYQFTVVPSADMTVSCTLADLTPEESWVAVSLSVSCALPASGSDTGSYLLYTGTGRRYGTVDSLRDVLTVTCRYERTGEEKTENISDYTLSSSLFGTAEIAEASDGTDTLTISLGDLTAQVYLILVAEDECQGMTVAYNAASVHVGDNVSNIFSTIGLTVSMKYQGEVAITKDNWADYVGIYSYSYLTAGDRPVESGQDRFAVIPAGTNEPGSDATKKQDILVNGCYSVTMTLNGCTSNLPGGLYLGGATHVFTVTPNTGYELETGDVVIGGAGTYTINEDGTATVTLENLVADNSVVVNATVVVPTHTVTFVADGVTVDTVTFAEGAASVTEPDVPPKAHYTGEWPSYILGTADITVEAVYTPITYTITFVDDGGNHAVTYTVLTESEVTAPTVTPRDGYTAAWPSWSVGYDNNQTVEAVYTPITLTGITAAYSGGTVAAGTTLDQLTGITVTATYSDGSTATVAAGEYTMGGTLTAGQDNTVTVTYQGMTATFTVTVEEEPAGETEIALTWTAGKLANAIGSAATTTTAATDFAYAHSQKITMEAGMTYKVVTGEISAMKSEHPKLGKWNYRIVFVDDDNIIRATTEIQAENADNVTVENIATDPTFVAGSDVSLATGFYVREYTAASGGGNIGNPIVNGMTNLTHLYKVG